MTKTLTMMIFFVALVVIFTPNVQAKEIDNTLYAQVLRKYVNDQGRVDYVGLKADVNDLNRHIVQIEQADLSGMSPTQLKTFWINAYNAITLKTVVDQYPVKSIRTINFGLVWKLDRKVAGGKKSLGDIEHKILRPLGDPRIHFAINCASIGCPQLPNVPFDSLTLDERLDEEARKFINDPQKVRLDRATQTLYYSAIFDWFKEDFLAVANDISSFIKKYINEEDRMFLENHSVKSVVLDYDWNLNRQ